MMAQRKKAMQHLLTYIPPRAGAAAADSVLSISLLNRENKPPKKSQYNLLHHSNFIIIIFFARNKDCEKKNKKKKQRNQSQNKQTFLIRFRKKKYRQIYHEISARLEINTSTIATKILHKFIPCSCVCGSLNKRTGSGGSSGNTVCSTPYVRNIIRIFHILYFRTYFRLCVSGYGMRPPHWLRRFWKDRFGIN